jgi:hypothetical protein
MCHRVLSESFCGPGWFETKGRLEFPTDRGGCWRCKDCGHDAKDKAKWDEVQRWCDERFRQQQLREHADDTMGIKAPDEQWQHFQGYFCITWVNQGYERPLVSDSGGLERIDESDSEDVERLAQLVSDIDCRGLKRIDESDSEDVDRLAMSLSQGIESKGALPRRWQRAARRASIQRWSSTASSSVG